MILRKKKRREFFISISKKKICKYDSVEVEKFEITNSLDIHREINFESCYSILNARI